MKRVLRNILIWSGRLLALVSLMLFVAIVALWMRGKSYATRDIFWSDGLVYDAERWELSGYYQSPGELPGSTSLGDHTTERLNLYFGQWRHITMKWVPIQIWEIDLQNWFLCIAFAILPIGYAVCFVRHRRQFGSGFPVCEAAGDNSKEC